VACNVSNAKLDDRYQHGTPLYFDTLINFQVSEKLLLGEIVPEEFDINFPERVFFDYLSDAYNQFFAGKDDFSESERQLEQQFDNRNAERLADIERLQEENDQLVRELTQLNVDAVLVPLLIFSDE
jgi:hypothetical protein